MQRTKPGLLIRADASEVIGVGHLMRCLALAEEWRARGGLVTFLTACKLEALNARLITSGFDLEQLHALPGSLADIDLTRKTAERIGAGWLVLDGYHFSAEYQRLVRGEGTRILAIDDFGHADHYTADLILNQNLHASAELYQTKAPHTRLLLGTRYTLLRSEFRKWIGWQREIRTPAQRILVTMGGSDTRRETRMVLDALKQVDLPALEVDVVVGSGQSPQSGEFGQIVESFRGSIQFHENVSNMPELMANADIAVAAGGTTTWERALLGLPSLVGILAPNQMELAEYSERMGIGKNLGPFHSLTAPALAREIRLLMLDTAARQRMASRGPEIVDGRGVDRVILKLDASSLHTRPVEAEDCRQIWEWANEPLTRAVSFSSDVIPWEKHVAWFTARLNNPACMFLIATDSNAQPIGQVRFDIDGSTAVISMSLDPRFRGLGYGPELIRIGIQKLFCNSSVTQVNALIRTDNIASQAMCFKTGFLSLGKTQVQGQEAYHLLFQKGQQ